MAGKCEHGLTTAECLVCASPKYPAAPAVPAAPEPDMRHPKIQALIGGNARKDIEMSLVEQLLEEGPEADVSSMCMEYWNSTHDKLREALLKAAPAEQAAASEFDHDIGADRFKVVKGAFWWHVRIGDGTANVGKFHSESAAQDMALKLLTAFRDGAYMQFHTSKKAPAAEAVQPEPVTLADVLDALNVFNRPKPNEDDGPWEAGHFLRVDYLPDFINVIAAAWFSAPVAQAEAVQPAQAVRLTDEQIDLCMPVADGTAEADATRVEVQPGMWGTEYTEVAAWSLPLVRQIVRNAEHLVWAANNLRGE